MKRKPLMPLTQLVPGLSLLLLALSGCSPQSTSDGNLQQQITTLSQGITRQQYAVQAKDLADRVIKQRNDHLLIDLRSDTTQRIKSATVTSAADLLTPQGRSNLPAGRDLILVSENGGQAAQTALLLRLQGIDAFYLDGGYAAWAGALGNVQGEPATPDEAAAMAHQQAVSCWFEGDYVAAAGLMVKTPPQAKGYTPLLEPVQRSEALGLGLDLGLGPQAATQEPARQAPAATPAGDDLGLGLGLGLGPEQNAKAQQKPRPKLLIGEGC